MVEIYYTQGEEVVGVCVKSSWKRLQKFGSFEKCLNCKYYGPNISCHAFCIAKQKNGSFFVLNFRFLNVRQLRRQKSYYLLDFYLSTFGNPLALSEPRYKYFPSLSKNNSTLETDIFISLDFQATGYQRTTPYNSILPY